MKEIRIHENDANQRLDKFLEKTFPELKKGMMYKAIRNKKIKVNRKRADFAQILQPDDVILLFLPDDVLVQKEKKVLFNSNLDVVYEDDNIVVADKPAGLLSQSAKEGQDCLVERLRAYLHRKGEYDPKRENHFAPCICNRLDRNTSGLVIGAKNAYAAREINAAIQQHLVHKFYHAKVEGHLRDDMDVTLYLKKIDTIAKVSAQPREGYVKAQMRVHPFRFEKDATWIKVELVTGRFHQIRACMAFLGFPLVGDRKYGSHRLEDMQLDAYRIVIDPIEMEMEQNEFKK
ncbi:RluA family pseudouridine synthase [uncultured Dubosiella sp.]|uniref:pseudouridine synthase n=1 Tax=uncultured Dubosiella sp. TaxID=1937011 RepID=UPI00258FF2F0|nr:RluA family pseudouridine synthase [uncultured Dubosiella sp.]